MSNSKMLIDATHAEETRVVVQRNGRVEEFDFESAARKLLRGNIYLAKVTRVEPSLQAAFVDYGGNRHGFLAFNEIHPDYYQIPVADRQALIDEEAAAEAELEAAADRRAEALARRGAAVPDGGAARHTEDAGGGAHDDDDDHSHDGAAGDLSNIVDVEEDEHIEEIGGDEDGATVAATLKIAGADPVIADPDDARELIPAEAPGASHPDEGPGAHGDLADDDDHEGAESDDHHDAVGDVSSYAADGEPGHFSSGDGSHHDDIDQSGAGNDEPRAAEPLEYSQARPRRRPRSYKIQEVIKRRQVILVQVVKEERGNKGAALTTYLSLAGRYTVLMPNTARGGGISRKITNPVDRKRLKAIAAELEVPEGMGLIIRTAGAARTKPEIKRDFEYLLRLWESVRDLTLQSTAPSLVYEEGDLIKRSIRDLYNKDVEEVLVAGDEGFHEAAGFMQMLMPSHTRNVIHYKDPTPLFTKHGVERQLGAMFSPQVTLRSGGYIVINQTEALVAIDVNSGKSTREFSIEETALATNLEASDEIARQLKLRDLAGLIVIDFIDMEEKRNNRSVERRLKDALRHDRARIQLGRISHFGLMEMSRQRLRTGVLEGSTSQCQHCQGTGIIRSTESVALAVLRGIEDAITAGASAPLIATTTPAVALYILNSKRAYVSDMEIRHGYQVTILGSERMQGANFTVERGHATAMPARSSERAAVNMDWGFEGEDSAPTFESGGIEDVGAPEDETEPNGVAARSDDESEGGGEDGARRGRRRRRRGRGRGDQRDEPRSRNGQSSERHSSLADGERQTADEFDPSSEPGDDEPVASTGREDDVERSEKDATGDERGDPRRRRRRGRRGGRRGRDRGDGLADANGDASADFAGNGHETTPGFEPQPDLSATAFGHTDDEAAAIVTSPVAERPARRARPERIWHRESAAARDVTVPSAGASNGHEADGATDRDTAASEPVNDVAPRTEDVLKAKPSATIAPAEVSSGRRRHEIGSSEPRIERVVVGGEPETDAPETSEPTQRKGWWQRKFGA